MTLHPKELKEQLHGFISRKKAESRILRIVLNKYFISAFIVFFWMLVLDTNNIAQWMRTNHRLREQEVQIETLQRDIDRAEVKIKQLSFRKDSLERFAREEYLFHEDGEDVYLLE